MSENIMEGITLSSQAADKVRSALKIEGKDGYNLRMSEVAASIGIEQIKKLSRFLISRRKNAKIIKNILRNIEDILVLPSQYKSSISSDFCVNIVLKSGNEKVRNSLILNLNKNIVTKKKYLINIKIIIL